MFNAQKVELIVELQKKSYLLLKWINNALKQQSLSFKNVHEAMSASEAAKEWIENNYSSIPEASRPDKKHLSKFSNLFTSYLTTSFELIENPGVKLASYCGCYCTMCIYLASANHLKLRKPSKKAKENSIELKTIYLNTLAEELELALIDSEILSIIKDPTMTRDVSMATYCSELFRRSEFSSQGEGVLILWRDFAWDGTHPKKKFDLSADEIISAEEKIIKKMNVF